MRIVAGGLLAVLLAGCGGTPPDPRATATPPAAAATAVATDERIDVGARLIDALALVPADAERVDYTNWALARAAEGMPARGDEMSEDQRREFLGGLFRRHATPSAFAYAQVFKNRATWGWDSTDLEWELTIHLDRSRVHVLRLPDHLPFPELETRFTDYGFSREERADSVVFSSPLDPRAEWVRNSDLAMRNSALVAGERLLLASSDAELLERVLDAREGGVPSLAKRDAVRAAVAASGHPIGARLLVGDPVCATVRPAWMSEAERVAWSRALMRHFPGLREFDALVVAYHYSGDQPTGTIALGYTNSEDAEDDLENRITLADAPSLRADDLSGEWDLSSLYFTLRDGRVEGSAVVLDVEPVGGQPRLLFDMVMAGDMLFAMC